MISRKKGVDLAGEAEAVAAPCLFRGDLETDKGRAFCPFCNRRFLYFHFFLYFCKVNESYAPAIFHSGRCLF